MFLTALNIYSLFMSPLKLKQLKKKEEKGKIKAVLKKLNSLTLSTLQNLNPQFTNNHETEKQEHTFLSVRDCLIPAGLNDTQTHTETKVTMKRFV